MGVVEELKEEFDEIDREARLRLIELYIKYDIKLLKMDYNSNKELLMICIVGLVIVAMVVLTGYLYLGVFDLSILMPPLLFSPVAIFQYFKFRKAKNKLKNYDGQGVIGRIQTTDTQTN